MPSKSKRLDQCCYREGKRRCMRSGTGNPSLCSAHKIAFAEAARKAANPTVGTRFAGMVDIADDFLNGRKISKDKVAEAISEFAWAIGGNFGAYRPDAPDGHGSRPPPGHQPPPPRWNDDERSAPPPPPDNDEACLRARRVLGYPASLRLTAEMLNKRRRELARKYHPDRPGGSTEKMKLVNDAVDTLLQELGG